MKQTIQIFLEGESPTLKYDLIKTDGIVKNKKRLFSSYLKVLFLTLTQITLNFKCYRKENNSKKKYNLYNTKRVQINNDKADNGLNEAFIRDN